MADFSALKTAIQANIRTNGNEEITGAILQDILLSMVTTMGDGAINALAEALAAEVAARQNAVGAEKQERQQEDSSLSGRINTLGETITAITTRLNEGYVYAGIATPSTNPGTPAGKVFYIALQEGTYTNFGSLVVTQGINILKYDGTAWSQEQLVGIDDDPTAESDNLVKSGGIFTFVKDSLPQEGIITWGKFINSDFSKATLGLRLICTKNDYINDFLAITQLQISEGLFVIIVKDLTETNSPYYGIYGISSTGLAGKMKVELPQLSTSALDKNSKLIAYIDFDNLGNGLPSQGGDFDFPRIYPFYKAYINNVEADIIADYYFRGISDIRCYVPDPSTNYYISMFGWNSTYGYFYFRLYNGDTDTNSAYGIWKPQNGIVPTSGKQTISMILDNSSNNQFYYAEVDIDWGVYNAQTIEFYSSAAENIKVNTFSTKQLTRLKGDIYVTSGEDITLQEGTDLYGEDCTIHLYAYPQFILQSNSSVNNIVFDDESQYKIVREEYSAAEIEEKAVLEYLFKPEVTLADLRNEYNETVYYIHANKGIVKIGNDAVNASINGCTFNNINAACIYDGYANNRHTTPKHGYITNNMFNCCRTGIVCISEFTRHYGNYFYGCITGVFVKCSNYNSVNCNFVRCDCGMWFGSEQNAHGEVSTLEFAHNGVAGVYAKTINDMVGFIFTNCQFAQAPVIADVAYALKFSSCRLDTYFIIASGAKNSIIGNNMDNSYAQWDEIANIFNVPSDTLVTLNRAMASSKNDNLFNT